MKMIVFIASRIQPNENNLKNLLFETGWRNVA